MPVEKSNDKTAANSKKGSAAAAKLSSETGTGSAPSDVGLESVGVDNDSVFPEPLLQVSISPSIVKNFIL